MLVRFIVKNLFSFGEQREFNMLPAPRHSRLAHHKYKVGGIELLKQAAIYGANGSGKSNLVKALRYLQELVLEDKLPSRLNQQKYRFLEDLEASPVLLALEFVKADQAFLYAVEFNANRVLTEELYLSGMGEKENTLIFERKTLDDNRIETRFSAAFESDAESAVLKKVIEKNLAKPEKPLFKLLSKLVNPFLIDLELAFDWFQEDLKIISPETKLAPLAHNIHRNKPFSAYANNLVRAFHTGIEAISAEKMSVKEFLGLDNADQLNTVMDGMADGEVVELSGANGEVVELVREGNNFSIKRLIMEHKGPKDKNAQFFLHEESDGTVRLLDYVPAFLDLVQHPRVYVIDEMERSIHPVLIKALIQKFSDDTQTKGQLIFTTHESNLLDQDIFRQDEIWFVEKDSNACSDLYPLSEFKEHHSKDIQKGYLNGRYDAIPFLGNLKDLNWNE